MEGWGGVRYLDSAPLIEAARGGRPWHLRTKCPYCYGRSGAGPSSGGGRSDRFSATCVTRPEVAERLGVSLRQVDRWICGRGITTNDLDRIDRLAYSVDSHPLTLWPDLGERWAA